MNNIKILLLVVGAMTGFTRAASNEGKPDATLRRVDVTLARGGVDMQLKK